MKVAVVGAAGRMGRWFTNYFIRRGHQVEVYDVRRREAEALAREVGASYAPTLRRCVHGSDLIFLSTPIEATPRTVARVGRVVDGSALLVEISSLKSRVIPALKRLPKQLTPLSLHPLFGPGLDDLRHGRMAVVEVNDLAREAEIAGQLFPEASFVKCSAEEHDRMMAYSLTLPYFVNLAFGLSISSLEASRLRLHAGTTLSAQLNLLKAVVQGSGHLIPTLLAKNPYSREAVDRYLEAAKALRRCMGKESELEKVVDALRRGLSSEGGAYEDD
jgi:prephenate dehydrogenase